MIIKSNSFKDVDLNGKIVVRKEETLSEKYRTFDNRLYRVTGGFGASPNSMGRAIFAECLGDGTSERFDHNELEGWLSDEEASQVIKSMTSLSMDEYLTWQRLKNE